MTKKEMVSVIIKKFPFTVYDELAKCETETLEIFIKMTPKEFYNSNNLSYKLIEFDKSFVESLIKKVAWKVVAYTSEKRTTKRVFNAVFKEFNNDLAIFKYKLKDGTYAYRSYFVDNIEMIICNNVVYHNVNKIIKNKNNGSFKRNLFS